MSITKRSLIATLLGSVALFLAFLPSRVVEGRSTVPKQASQQAPAPHDHGQTNVVNGAVHPELIPDKEAFRLFFLAVGTDSKSLPEDLVRQRSMLAQAKLSAKDAETAVGILTEFKQTYDALVQKYNDAVAAATTPAELPDGGKLNADTDVLTLTTEAKMGSQLSPSGFRSLYAFVQSEKSKMSVTVN